MLIALLTMMLLGGSSNDIVDGHFTVYSQFSYKGVLVQKQVDPGNYEATINMSKNFKKLIISLGSGLSKKNIKFKIPATSLPEDMQDVDEIVLNLFGEKHDVNASGTIYKVSELQPVDSFEQECKVIKQGLICKPNTSCGGQTKLGTQIVKYQDTKVHYKIDMDLLNKSDGSVVANFNQNLIRTLRRIIEKSTCQVI